MNYCQHWLSNPMNYTLNNLADLVEELSCDRINCYARKVYQPNARISRGARAAHQFAGKSPLFRLGARGAQ